MKKLYTILLFIVFSGVALCSSTNDFNISLFNVDNGLPQSSITCIIQDSYGFLWLGTQDGLARYDGYEFHSYRNNPLDSNSLSYNFINSICEDRSGNLWVATIFGLSMLDRKTDKFINYYHNPDNNTTISDNRVYNVFQDRKGNIWVKTFQSLDYIDISTRKFIRYPHYNDLFTFSSEVNDYSIFEDSQGWLWVGTKDGLLYFDRQLSMFKRYYTDPNNPSSISSNKVKDIYEDSHHNLLIGTDNGLNIFNRKSDSFIRFYHNPGNKKSIPSNIVNSIFEDHEGILWLGTDAGFCSFNPQKNEANNYENIIIQNQKLNSYSINAIFEDQSQIFWIGSMQGLIKYDRKGYKFNRYSKTADGENLFSNNIIASIFKDSNGWIWLGTWGSGLFRYDPQTGENINYSRTSSRRICNDFVHVIYYYKNKDLLIGTRDGVQKYLPNNDSFVDYFNYRGIDQKDAFRNNRVNAMAEDTKGNLWIASGLGLYCVSDGKIVGYHYDANNPNSLSSNETYNIICDKDGLIWVGTFNGLNCLDPINSKVTHYNRPGKYTGSELISNEIICLFEDREEFLWVGTTSGLHKFDKKKRTFKLFTEQDGLPNNLIYSIKEDNKGFLWVSTDWGIASFNKATNDVVSYDLTDGLLSHEFNIGSSYISQSGEIFFGGLNGVNSFFPDSIRYNTLIPNIAITNLQVITKRGVEKINAADLEEIILPMNFNTLVIEFSALDFTCPEKNQYAIKMEGLQDQWIDVGNKRVATYSNLKTGEYFFKVKGSNSDKIWNEKGLILKIRVVAPFWMRKYAIAVYSLLIIFAIFWFVRNRTRNLIETRRLLKDRETVMIELQNQKEELIFKNKNITDSINYAKRIQEAIMPSISHIKKLLPDSFILYMPKDIVSGDFYWINETKNKIFVAVIDCTGHGVPGAFMSIIGVELLRNITNIQGVNDASEILNRLNTGINETFSKGMTEEAVRVKDGMDVAFCVIDKENNILQYAGAFSNLYLIRDNKITEIKGDRYSVGVGNESGRQFFSSHYIPIHQDDMLYIFTDGYVDQFGGPDGKKYKFRRFRHLLLNIHKFPLELQRQYIEESIKEWKGNFEQVDDILIIGIKPDLSCLF